MTDGLRNGIGKIIQKIFCKHFKKPMKSELLDGLTNKMRLEFGKELTDQILEEFLSIVPQRNGITLYTSKKSFFGGSIKIIQEKPSVHIIKSMLKEAIEYGSNSVIDKINSKLK